MRCNELTCRSREERRGVTNQRAMSFIQQAAVEGQGEQVAEAMAAGLLRKVGEDHLEVAAELPEDLAARAARGRGAVCIGDDCDATKTQRSIALGDRLEHGNALGADR